MWSRCVHRVIAKVSLCSRVVIPDYYPCCNYCGAQEAACRASARGLPRPVVDIVFAGAGAVSAERYQRRVWWSGGVELRVRVEGGLIRPQFEQDERIGVEGPLKDLVC